MDDINLANTYAAKFTIGGWFIGLAYYGWIASNATHIPWWIGMLLVVGSLLFGSSIIIGGGMMVLLGAFVTHMPWWVGMLLVVGGLFGSSIIIGGGMALVCALITRILTGDPRGSPHAYAWATYISPVLSFFAAKYALQFAGSF